MSKQIFHNLKWIILLAAICIFLSPAQAAPGDLDLAFGGFGTAGVVTQDRQIWVKGIAAQPDGKLITLGSPNGFDLTVYRYLPDGQPDPSFDGDGKVIHENMFVPSAVALQSDGRIVVGGTRNNDFHLARLTTTGALDLTFDGDGLVEDFDSELEELNAILVQRDGKIVACGRALAGGDADFGIARYTTSGARDNFFSGDGKVTIGFGEADYCDDIAQQADAKLVFVGSRWSFNGDADFAVARLETTGLLDTDDGDGGFDGDGKLTTGFGGDEWGKAVAIQPDGKILVLGSDLTPDKSFVVRYNIFGSLDNTFDGDGKLTIPVDYLNDLEILPDGKLLALGHHQSPDGDQKFALHRRLANGAPDTTFGSNGIVWLNFGGNDRGSVLALQPDGRILAAGLSDGSGLIVRLWPDASFDTGGQQAHTLIIQPSYPLGSDATTSAVVVQPDGNLLVAGELRRQDDTRSDAFVARFLPDGQIDTTFGSQGVATLWAGRYNAARAIALQPDGKIVIAGYADYTVGWVEFMVARFNSDGSYDNSFGTNNSNYRLANFSTGPSPDYGYALALAPDGKIVVAGSAWNGSRQVWGIARWNNTGIPDSSFGTDGKAFVDFNGSNTAKAVVIQPDRKIIIGGDYNGDFFLQRLLESGLPDPSYGINGGGYNYTDMGGNDSITALALDPNGWLYAAGYTWNGGADDFALAQYQPNGILAQCQNGQPCNVWPDGKRFVNIGGSDSAYALVLRGDNQLVAAGCSDWHMAAAQVSTTDVNAQPLLFNTDFYGHFDCAFGVQFSDAQRNKIILAGMQSYHAEGNIALARFETTPDGTVPPPPPPPPTGYKIYLPAVVR